MFGKQNLPPKDAFNSKSSESVIFRPDTYGEVFAFDFEAFDCKNLGDYIELYRVSQKKGNPTLARYCACISS